MEGEGPGQRGPGQRGPGQRGPGQRGPGQRGPGQRGVLAHYYFSICPYFPRLGMYMFLEEWDCSRAF